MKYIFIIFIFVFFTINLFAQYNERAIMTQNAMQLYQQRQFAQAELAWLQLLEKYPDDINAVIQLFNLYISLSQPVKARQTFNQYQSILPANLKAECEISILIEEVNLAQALNKSIELLQKNLRDSNQYRLLASKFERKGFYEHAIAIYEFGRTNFHDVNAFRMEIANAALRNRQYDKALTEYLAFLDKNPANVYFVNNQVKTILLENPLLIDKIKVFAEKSTTSEIKELYAMSLNSAGSPAEALTVYKQLPPEKLYHFANEQSAAGNDSISITAYTSLLDSPLDDYRKSEIRMRLGQQYFKRHEYSLCRQILQELIRIDSAKSKTAGYYSKHLPSAYLLLIEIAIRNQNPIEEILPYYQEARRFAYSADLLLEIEFHQIYTYYTYAQNDKVLQLLHEKPERKSADKRFYYEFLLAFEAGDEVTADSLLNELIITQPASNYINDMITLNILLLNISKSSRTEFFHALRLKYKHLDSLAVASLLTINNENVRILAADWALEAGLYNTADFIYSSEWQDTLLEEYSVFQKSRIVSAEQKIQLAQDFLRHNPESVFSPGLRQILLKLPSGKPNL